MGDRFPPESAPVPHHVLSYHPEARKAFEHLCKSLAANGPQPSQTAQVCRRGRHGDDRRAAPRVRYMLNAHVFLSGTGFEGAIEVPVYDVAEGGICTAYPLLAFRHLVIPDSPRLRLNDYLSDWLYQFEPVNAEPRHSGNRLKRLSIISYDCCSKEDCLRYGAPTCFRLKRIACTACGLTPWARWLGHYLLQGGWPVP